MSKNHKECEDNNFGLHYGRRRGNHERFAKDAITALQGQKNAMNNLLQSMTLTQPNAMRSQVQMVKKIKEMGCIGCGGPYDTNTLCP